MLGFLLCYAALGTLVTTAGFGRRLMQLTYSVLQREADLRFALVRVRENAGRGTGVGARGKFPLVRICIVRIPCFALVRVRENSGRVDCVVGGLHPRRAPCSLGSVDSCTRCMPCDCWLWSGPCKMCLAEREGLSPQLPPPPTRNPSAESIAFYSGDRHEAALASYRLRRAVQISLSRLWCD